MRRLVVALVAVALVLALAGCGGGGQAAAPAETPPVAAPPVAAAPVDPAAAAAAIKLSANEPPVFTEFPADDTIPKNVRQLVDEKQPTLIYFYDSSQNASKENRKMISSVLKSNRGLVELVAYDIGKYVSSDAAKPVTLKQKSFDKDKKYQQSIELARLLGVTSTPFMVLTDSQGYIVWKFRGLTDKALLEREILRASN